MNPNDVYNSIINTGSAFSNQFQIQQQQNLGQLGQYGQQLGIVQSTQQQQNLVYPGLVVRENESYDTIVIDGMLQRCRRSEVTNSYISNGKHYDVFGNLINESPEISWLNKRINEVCIKL